jgi:adenylate cyclase
MWNSAELCSTMRYCDAEELDNKEAIGALKGNIGSMYLNLGDVGKAEEMMAGAVQVFNDLGNKWEQAKMTFNLGSLYFQKNDVLKALKFFKDAEALLSVPGDKIVKKTDTSYFKVVSNPRIKEYYQKEQKTTLASIYGNTGAIYMQQGNQPMALEYLLKSIKLFEETGGIKVNLLSLVNNVGILYTSNGDLEKALEYYFKAMHMAHEVGNRQLEGTIGTNIGTLFMRMNEPDTALKYYQRSLKIFEDISSKENMASDANNIGDAYFHLHNYSRALEYGFRSFNAAKELDNSATLASADLTIGAAYVALAEDTTISLTPESSVIITKYLPMGQDALPGSRAMRLSLAIDFLQQCLVLAKQIQFADIVKDCNKQLAKAYQLSGDSYNALHYFQDYAAIKDSMFSKENDKKIVQQQMKYDYGKREDSMKLESEKKELALQKEIELKAVRYEFEKKQAAAKSEKERQQLKYEQQLKEQQIEYEYAQKIAKAEAEQKQKETERKQREALAKVEQEKKDALTQAELRRERNIRYASVAGILGLAIFTFFIFKERKKSDMLLLNILPSSVAKELKKKGSADAKLFDDVTVLFTDFVSFTKVSERLTPQELVNELHECFKAFDQITQRHGIEKIKTVGDAYLAVCGLPKANPDHAINVVKATIEMRDFMLRRKEELGDKTFAIRLGVHSGNVVAGIVGIKKFAYDIWGDTVNTAARMEQNSQAGKINISQSTYALVHDKFNCEYRGEIDAKNKGALKMYFVE